MVPVKWYITGDGQFSKAAVRCRSTPASCLVLLFLLSGSRARYVLNVENFFKELYIGYASMVKN